MMILSMAGVCEPSASVKPGQAKLPVECRLLSCYGPCRDDSIETGAGLAANPGQYSSSKVS
jgi:hypothetical protein